MRRRQVQTEPKIFLKRKRHLEIIFDKAHKGKRWMVMEGRGWPGSKDQARMRESCPKRMMYSSNLINAIIGAVNAGTMMASAPWRTVAQRCARRRGTGKIRKFENRTDVFRNRDRRPR